MRRWIITGPIGAGKSAAVAWLRDQHGAAVFSGDELGHRVLREAEVQARLVSAFGVDILTKGHVDRGILGPRVFADPEALRTLNRITHPRICRLAEREFAELARQGNHPLAVLEAAVYFLFPEPPRVDLVVSVLADERVRADRLARQRQLSPEQVAARLRAQRELTDMWDRADVVVDNSGSMFDLGSQLDRLVQEHSGTTS